MVFIIHIIKASPKFILLCILVVNFPETVLCYPVPCFSYKKDRKIHKLKTIKVRLHCKISMHYIFNVTVRSVDEEKGFKIKVIFCKNFQAVVLLSRQE